jgi:hypothetical protein
VPEATPLLVLAAVAALLCGAALLLALRRRRGSPRPWAAVRKALADADAARARSDAQAEAASHAQALRAALAVRLPATRSLSPEEIATLASDDAAVSEAAELLRQLEVARFANGPAPALPAARVRDAVAALRRGRWLLFSRAPSA